jgi:Domain of unknown function (DUF4157)
MGSGMSGGFDRRGPNARAGRGAAAPSSAVPGKTTLVQAQLARSTRELAPTVQRATTGGVPTASPAASSPEGIDGDAVHQAAARGVAGSGGPLPHADMIQRAFGRHDVSGVRAHVGGAAESASREIGAHAYATGNQVAFAHAPSLHLAAHEAAHVVQQRGGVQLKAGVGERGDAYEQHADQVTDQVMRGESAEALLDKMGPAEHRGSTTVQRKEAAKPPAGMVNARRYLSFHANAAHTAIELHLKQQRLPQPHPRMQWHDERAFYESLFVAFNTFATSFEHPEDFAQAMSPGDPFHLIDSMRPIATVPAEQATDDKQTMYGGVVGPWNWLPGIGTAIAQMVEQSVIQSLYRLGARWLEIAELGGPVSGTVFVDENAIARSHPMDRYVRTAMCRANVFTVVVDASSAKKPAKKTKSDATGVTPVQLEWVGKQHPELWNWVRATPTTATAEDVSAEVFKYMTESDHEKTADYYAAFLAQAPPMFGIPPQWAKTFPETRGFRPSADKIAAADSDPDHQITTLAGSKVGDDQALLEATPGAAPKDKKAKPPEPDNSHDEIIADVLSQATFLKGKLGAWHLGAQADKAIAFAARRKQDGADAAKWVPALTAQRENLTTISTGILQLDTVVDQMKLKSKTGDEARPLREIMRFYGDAVATAHMKETAKHLIMRAANAQSALTLQGLQSSVHDMDTAADMMRGSVANNDWDRNKASNNVSHLDDEGLALQSHMMRGDAVSADDIEDYQVRVEEASLDSKMIAIEYALRELAHSADEAGVGLAAWFAALPSSKFRHLGEATEAIRAQVSDVRFKWDSARNRADTPTDEQAEAVMEEKKLTLQNRRKAVQDAKAAFIKVSKDSDISEFLQSGANTVKWQSFRTACVKIAALIGVSLVGGFIGGMVARGAASLMMGAGGATAVEGLSLGGTIVARGLGMATETVLTSAGQTAIFGGGYGVNFLENMIMNLGSAGVMKMIGEGAADAMRVEKAVGGMWSKAAYGGKVVLAQSAIISGHLIMGVAMGYVAHKIVTGESQPPPATVEEWLLQGASIAVGRYVGHGLAAHAEGRKKLAAANVEGAPRLVADAEKLAALSKQAEHNPQAKDAMELLAKRHQLLTEEMKLLEELEKSPAKMKEAKLGKSEIAKTKRELKSQLAESHSEGFTEVALHTSGMRELIPGALWSGTESQVTEMIAKAQESGISASATKDPRGGRWRVKVGDKEILVEERVPRTGTPNAPPSAGHAGDEHAAPPPMHEGAAAAVPHSSFVGNKGTRALTLADVPSHLEGACALLNGAHTQKNGPVLGPSSTGAPFFDAHGPTDVQITTANKRIRVHIEIMPATEDVARHNFKDPNRSTATIWVSEKARPADITRALAHELAEIQSIASGAPVGGGAPGPGLEAHQYGRKAEVHTLLFEIDQATRTAASKTDQSGELKALVTHMGFEPGTIGSNVEAKRILGADEVARIDEALNKPRIVLKPTVAHPKGKMVGSSWVFEIYVNLPGAKAPVEVVGGSVTMKPDPARPGKFLVDETQTLDFVIKKTKEVNGREVRIEVEGHKQLTDYVMKEAISQFEAEFHEKPVMGGMLAWDNKVAFQHAYAEVEQAAIQGGKKLTKQQISDQAILKTKFGEARYNAGYHVTTTPSGEMQIVTGDPPRLAIVPEKVEALARPKVK